MKKYIIALFFIPIIGSAQNSTRDKKYIARKQINELHEGILLVKLSTYDKKTSAMEQAGMHDEVKRFKSGIDRMNNDLVKAFISHFKFCPVYFFYSQNSEDIKNRKLEGLILDAALKVADVSSFGGKNLFIAEIGKTESDTAMLNDLINYQYNDSAGMETRQTYYEGTNISYLALLIRSDQFIQLQKPFPAYIKFKSYDQVPVKAEKINNAVIKLDRELKAFYKKNK